MTSPALDLTTRLVRAPDPIVASVGDALVMMDMDNGAYYSLDEIATSIWRWLEQPLTVAELLARLQREYDVSPRQCEDDVLPFLEQLYAAGLVRRVG